jgi:hypothetical protein
MAANMTGIGIEETTVIGTTEERTQGRASRKAGYGVVIALLAAILIGGVALQDRHASRNRSPATTAAIRPVIDMDKVEQQKFLEENRMLLPSAAASAINAFGQDFTEQQVVEFDTLTAINQSAAPTATSKSTAVVMSEQQRYLEESTTAADTVTYQRTIDSVTDYELNTYCDATAAHASACFFPQPGQGMELKAERQADGTWQVVARFEMPVDDGR